MVSFYHGIPTGKQTRTKSLPDTTGALVLSSTLGMLAVSSALSVLVHQGAITLLTGFLPLAPPVLDALATTGGAIVLGIAFNPAPDREPSCPPTSSHGCRPAPRLTA